MTGWNISSFSEKDQFLKTLGKRISDTDMMKDVCLAMGMKSHQIESHLTDYSKKINEAAFEAFRKWWTENTDPENTANNKSERELLTTMKTVCGFYTKIGLRNYKTNCLKCSMQFRVPHIEKCQGKKIFSRSGKSQGILKKCQGNFHLTHVRELSGKFVMSCQRILSWHYF